MTDIIMRSGSKVINVRYTYLSAGEERNNDLVGRPMSWSPNDEEELKAEDGDEG